MARSARTLPDLRALRTALSDADLQKRDEAPRDRPPSPDDGSLFRQAMQDVRPLRQKARAAIEPDRPPPIARQHINDERLALAESLSDELDVESLLETDAGLWWRRDGIGPDIVRKLRRGHWIVQDELDLHGARKDEARDLVGSFVRDRCKRGIRCVRIIHGKGLGSVDRQPILKAVVRRWLVQKDEVLAFCQARGHDGGSGALIVLLRSPTRPRMSADPID